MATHIAHMIIVPGFTEIPPPSESCHAEYGRCWWTNSIARTTHGRPDGRPGNTSLLAPTIVGGEC